MNMSLTYLASCFSLCYVLKQCAGCAALAAPCRLGMV